eukprot:5943243-Karenia_brevis.AAC.1
METWTILESMRASEPFKYNKLIKQGGMDAPFLWNLVLRRHLCELHRSWQQAGYGILLDDGTCVTHFLWSDNVYLVACTLQQLHVMAQELTDSLQSCGLQWKET